MTDPRFEKALHIVEATDCERQYLWLEWHAHHRMPWVQDGFGSLNTIGKVGRKPVCVSVTWALLGPRCELVLFYSATSQVVDYSMVDKWIRKACPQAQHSDANNFYHCVAKVWPNRGDLKPMVELRGPR